MNETYAEWLIKRKIPLSAYLAECAMVVLCIASIFFTMGNPFGIVILTLVGAATYFVFRNAKVEYEYLFVSGQLSIDKILGQSKRKNVWEGSMDEIEIIAPVQAYQLKDYERPEMKTLDFTSGMQRPNTYAVISRAGGMLVKVLIEPNQKLLQCFRQSAPRKVIMNQ